MEGGHDDVHGIGGRRIYCTILRVREVDDLTVFMRLVHIHERLTVIGGGPCPYRTDSSHFESLGAIETTGRLC